MQNIMHTVSQPKILFTHNYHLSKGDILYECFKNITVKTQLLSDPVESTINIQEREWKAWDWDAEVLYALRYKSDGIEWTTEAINSYPLHQHYRISDYPCQGGPKLFLEDIYQNKVGKDIKVVHNICTPLGGHPSKTDVNY